MHALDGPIIVGVIDEVTRDTLRLRDENEGATLFVPVWRVTRLEVAGAGSTRQSNMLRGSVAGFAIGAVLGGGLGASTCSGRSDGFGGTCNDAGKRLHFIVGGALILGVPMAVLGAVIGAASPLEQWHRVWP